MISARRRQLLQTASAASFASLLNLPARAQESPPLRLVVTFVLAEVSHHLVEAPFRRGSVPRRTLLVAAPAAIASSWRRSTR